MQCFTLLAVHRMLHIEPLNTRPQGSTPQQVQWGALLGHKRGNSDTLCEQDTQQQQQKRIAMMATAWFWPVLTDLHQKFQLKIFPSNTTTSPLATPGWISAWWKLDKANLDKIRSMCLWHETKESSRHLPQQDFVQKTLLRTSYKYTEGYIFMLETYIWWRWPSLQNEIGKVRWWDCEVRQRKRAQTAFC